MLDTSVDLPVREQTRLLLGEARSSLVRNVLTRAGFGIAPELEARFEAAGDTPFGEAFAAPADTEIAEKVLDHLTELSPHFDEDEVPLDQSIVFESDLDDGAEGEHPIQPSMFREHPEMDEHAHAVEHAVVSMASSVLDKGAVGEFAAKLKVRRQSVTQEGQLIDEVWSIAVTARPVKA